MPNATTRAGILTNERLKSRFSALSTSFSTFVLSCQALATDFSRNLVTKVKSQIEQNVFIINRRKSVIRKRSSLSSTVTVSLLGNSESTTLTVRVGATFINLAQQRHSSFKITSKYLIRSKCDLKRVPYLFLLLWQLEHQTKYIFLC